MGDSGFVLEGRCGFLGATGVVLVNKPFPTVAANRMAEGRIEPGAHPPEAVIEAEPFFKEMERREKFTKLSVSHLL